ncbi:hypothetical protein M011DRAFT_398962 [Sporormia fimetaria CBS 119925]|uniref:Uncharacterized protein n=1 Tax=Sporormia fimetaria CBS 119925 TaxID=1340428 RepID=A0A6A6VJ65_9PLEO|nr:hypothetical protein M011DRAFT_398962 [Sporormia fimetaria CBS 119925]
MPVGARRSLSDLARAGMTWVKSRRGRALAIAAACIVVLITLFGITNVEYVHSAQSFASSYLPSWRPNLSKYYHYYSPLTPSNTTLDLEAGKMKHPPSQLEKESPNFHLVLPAVDENAQFCKTTMSGMILNFPPPTVIGLYEEFKSQMERDRALVGGIKNYLSTDKYVRDEDLVLIVDGEDTWFQLPSDIVIRHYQSVVAAANQQLLDTYGQEEDGEPRFSQSIVFGAQKTCDEKILTCKRVPDSTLPKNAYGQQTDQETTLTRARYLDSGMMMGPAKQLRSLYEEAAKRMATDNGKTQTAQNVFAEIFEDQELARSVTGAQEDPQKTRSSGDNDDAPILPGSTELKQHEFTIGLDYTHTLFQPMLHTAIDELVPLAHNNATAISVYQRPDTPKLPTTLPPTIAAAKPPFWVMDLTKHNPSPNEKTAFIAPLSPNPDIDTLPPRDTPWDSLHLIKNTYTGSIPSILHANIPASSGRSRQRKRNEPTTLTPTSLWYTPHARALLRNYFRAPQSVLGYHNAAVGGDSMWDQRGGRGGIWVASNSLWLPWGEIDGVCGTFEQLSDVLNDGKGVWMHEAEKHGEEDRKKEESELKKLVEEEEKKAEKEGKKLWGDRRESRMWVIKGLALGVRDKIAAERRERDKEEAEGQGKPL